MLPLTDRFKQLGAFIDMAVGAVDPVLGEKRRAARDRVGAFESAKTNRLTNVKRSIESGDGLLDKAGKTLRERARWLDENHDVAIGIMDVLVNNIVGTGIGIEPQAKLLNGELNEDLNDLIYALHEDWSEHPEVTWMHDHASMDRIACLSWLRDGEALGQLVSGDAKLIDHGTEVPFSVELIETDFLPLDYNDIKKNIRQGIQRNAWGRPMNFCVYKANPLDAGAYVSQADLKMIPTENMVFLRYSRRISQLRGNSIMASVINRLGDVKMYEDYERVAAQVAAALTVFISRDMNSECPEYMGTPGKNAPARAIAPGMMLEGLPGEKPEIIQSSRPNNQLEVFRKANLRAAASGTSTGYSAVSKDYNGSYSAQRQELVEQSIVYKVIRNYFISRWSRPIYQRFVQTALLSGKLDKFLNGTDMKTISSAMYTGALMPWIDPQKEIGAVSDGIQLGITTRSQTIRERGGNPRRIAKQLKADDKLFGPLKPPGVATPAVAGATEGEPAGDGLPPDDSATPPTQAAKPAAARRSRPNGHAKE